MQSIQTIFRRPIEEALAAVSKSEWSDIYVISFYIDNEDDDPRRPLLVIGYNTESNYKASISRASNEQEACWNFTFWLQNELLVFGRSGSESATLVQSWIHDQGFGYTDEEEEEDFDRCMELGDEIITRFVEECCQLVSSLHKDGVISAICGRSIPVLVHELEYYHEIADQNERANPPSVVHEFVGWIRQMYK